jgi:hypothetical protein
MSRKAVRLNKKNKILAGLLIVLLVGLGGFFYYHAGQTPDLKKITIGHQSLWVELAVSQAAQAKGLSGRDNLPQNQGMLFVFAAKGQPNFWMKEMRFPLDFIWLADGRVVEIAENIEPPPPGLADKDLALYRPGVMVNQVLEVNAGWAKEHGIKLGDKLAD